MGLVVCWLFFKACFPICPHANLIMCWEKKPNKDLSIDKSIVHILLRWKYNRWRLPVRGPGAQLNLVVSHMWMIQCQRQYKMIPTFRYLNSPTGYYSDCNSLGKIHGFSLYWFIHLQKKKRKKTSISCASLGKFYLIHWQNYRQKVLKYIDLSI